MPLLAVARSPKRLLADGRARVDDAPHEGDLPVLFPAKRHGWGWGAPTVWQGWAVMAAYVAAVAAPVVLVPGQRALFIATLITASALLLWVVSKKGEAPKWRWGDRER